MTTVPTLNPQIIGRAENAHLPILAPILARFGVSKNQWVALTLAANSGVPFDHAQLAGRVAGALKIDDEAASGAVTELVDARMLHATSAGITDAGKAQYRLIRNDIDEIVTRVYGDLPADDLVTAARVLTIITARLNAETAGV
jgi:hypothetical protein